MRCNFDGLQNNDDEDNGRQVKGQDWESVVQTFRDRKKMNGFRVLSGRPKSLIPLRVLLPSEFLQT